MKLIKNKAILQEYVEWLPELKKGEVFYLTLIARRKYNKSFNMPSEITLSRKLVTKSNFIYKIEEMEATYRIKDQVVPNTVACLYTNPTPRSQYKAVKAIGKLAWDWLNATDINLYHAVLNAVQASRGSHFTVGLDIDTKDVDLTTLLKGINCKVIETANGYHIHLTDATPNKDIKTLLTKTKDSGIIIDQVGDFLSPVPGCRQSNFVPKFIK